MPEHKSEPITVEQRDTEPVESVEEGDKEENAEPQPEENEDFLVKNVDNKNALF